MPTDGNASAFSFGRAQGRSEAIPAALGLAVRTLAFSMRYGHVGESQYTSRGSHLFVSGLSLGFRGRHRSISGRLHFFLVRAKSSLSTM